jgi:hypothetical protein
MAGSTTPSARVVAGLGGRVLARRRIPPQVGGRELASALIERRSSPSSLAAATRLARGRSLPRAATPARPESGHAAGLSEFAARWLFGDGPPDGIPFSDAAAQAALASISSETGLPSFLEDEEASPGEDVNRASRLLRVTRGRVDEISSYRLSRTPLQIPGEPSQARLPQNREADFSSGIAETGSVAAVPARRAPAPETAVQPPRQPATPPARLVVRPSAGSEAIPEAPRTPVRRLVRARAAPPDPTTGGPRLASVSRLVGRVHHTQHSRHESATDARPEHAAPTHRRALRLASRAPASPREVRQASALFRALPVRRLLRGMTSVLGAGESATENAPETPDDRPHLRGAPQTASVARTPGWAGARARPRVTVPGSASSSNERRAGPVAGTSGVRLAAAARTPLVPGLDGSATVVFAPTAFEAEPSLAHVGAASAASIARFPDLREGSSPASATAAAPALAPAFAGPETLDIDEVYEQVVERLRRDLVAERERMGDLLGDFRR